ncbi:MAG: aminopeptidase [Gaiellaceae bacterium]
MDDELLERYAKLIVEVGANVQHGQSVLVTAAPDCRRLVRAVAAECYAHGARFVDPWYFDPFVKLIRANRAPEDSLELVPPWYPTRILALGEGHGCRISISPVTPPGLMSEVDPARAGRDQLPSLTEMFGVINAKTTNWCVVPWATPDWARVVYPALHADASLAKLWEDLLYVLRFDEPDPAAAWRDRFRQLHDAAAALDGAGLDALRFEGPGTDLTVGLLPTSHFANEAPGTTTVDGIVHHPNLPSEEIFTTPDPGRTEGVVTATKPLDLGGTMVRGLRVRFEEGRAVQIDADEGAEALRARCAKDAGASRLGEVALVDCEGRIGKTGTVFFNTLLDENAASHLAFGSAYAIAVGEADHRRINESSIHVDFMIGSNDVAVTGRTRDGSEVPVLREGSWQL